MKLSNIQKSETYLKNERNYPKNSTSCRNLIEGGEKIFLKKGLKFNVKRGLENIKESEEVVFEV